MHFQRPKFHALARVQVGGLLLVEPASRLSMLLKRTEMQNDEKSKSLEYDLDAIIHKMPYLDILEESDQLLHHR